MWGKRLLQSFHWMPRIAAVRMLQQKPVFHSSSLTKATPMSAIGAPMLPPIKKDDQSEHSFSTDLVTTVSKGLGVSIGTGFGLSLFGPAAAIPSLAVGFIGSLACGVRLGKFQETEKQQGVLTEEQRQKVKTTFWGMCGLAGGMLTPVFFTLSNPWVVPVAFGATSLMTLSLSRVALRYQSNILKGWRAPLLSGLLGLVVLDLSALATMLVVGPNPFSEMVMTVDLHGGLLLFSGLLAYDSQAALEIYRKNPQCDKHLVAVDLFWDAINFFIRLLELLNKAQKKD